MDTNTIVNINVSASDTPVRFYHASRRRRVLAFLTDLSILGCIFAALFTAVVYLTVASGNFMLVFLMLPVALMWGAAIILRDVIFGKASLGKRILGIRVVAKDTGEPATKKARAVRGFASLISFFDFLFLLISRKSLGDRLGDTAVVYAKVNESIEDGIVVPTPVKRGGGIALIAVVLSFAIMISSIVASVIFSMKLITQKEEYALAVEYIVESPYFETLGIPAEEIEFAAYSYSTKNGITTAEFTFIAETDSFTDTIVIVCVNENGTWRVNESTSRVHRNK